MSYYLLIKDKVIAEGDTLILKIEGTTIDFMAEVGPDDITINIKIMKINPEDQSFRAALDSDGTMPFDISIADWKSASIIKRSEITNPNIKFKLYHGHNDGQ